MSVNLDNIRKRFNRDLTNWKPIPFWSWNDKLDPQELCRQIDWMNKNEIGGFFMHARGGLKTEYLSKDWMDCISASADHAEKLGMNAWAYDENGWPSGFAGGKLLEDPNNRDKYILYETGEFDPNATVSYLLEKEKLTRVVDGNAAGKYLNLYIHTAVSTADILNPEVLDKFIALTHEAYKAQFGEDFSKKIHGFFTDEPQYQRWHTPFTDVMFDYYAEQYGGDILDELGLLFVEKAGYCRFRYRYWKAMQHLMIESFAKKLYKWCTENGVNFTGHYIEEASLAGQMLCCAGIMPFYKYMTMPGIDWLGRFADNPIPVRQLASVAAQYGKSQALTETFACCGWEISPRDIKRIADFQFVNGVNMLCHHLVPYAEYGQRKKDHPAHYSDVNPWVSSEFADFNRYYTRLGHLLSQSREPVNVAVLQPVRSAYLEYKREDEDSVKHIDDLFFADSTMLSSAGISYHYLDETLLAEDGFVKGDKIGCGKCTYDFLILPHVFATDATTEKLLREYTQNGGKLLCLGDFPVFCEGEPFDYSYLASNCTLEDIIAAQPFSIKNRNTMIYNTYREIDGERFMFIQNASENKAYTQVYNFGKEIKSFKKLDLITLEETNIPLKIKLEPGESVLLFPDTVPVENTVKLTEYTLKIKDAAVSCASNKLTVDYVRYSIDGTDYSERYPCAALFAKLLEDRYEGDIYFKYEFDIRAVPSDMVIAVEDCNAIEHWLNGKSFSFTERSDIEKHILKADIAALVHEGINEYVVKLNWYQSEDVYYALFGENVTESLRNCLVYNTELEAIYLSGSFGVFSDTKFKKGANKSYLYGDKFYIDCMPDTVTEPTTDGFAFFAGDLTLRQTVTLESPDTSLRLGGTWHIAHITVNGSYAGKMLFNRTLDISKYAVAGENEIEITLTIGNRNLLGPHHNTDKDENTFVSPFNFELSGTWKNGKSEVYADRYNLIKVF